MSFYRIREYPFRGKKYRHTYIRRDRWMAADRKTRAVLVTLEEEEKSAENLSRARRMIRDYILCNQFDYFCTFTFDQGKIDRFDYDACKKKLAKFFDNYRQRKAPDFRYILVPEFHSNGAVHFHGMVRGIHPDDFSIPEKIEKYDAKKGFNVLVPNTKKYVRWDDYSNRFGFFSCSKVKHYEACANYVSKYMTKDLMKMQSGQCTYMVSKGLMKPELVFDEDDIPLYRSADFHNEFVEILDDDSHFGLLPDWWGDGCSELRHPDPDEDELPITEKEIFFPRLTGKQLGK